MENITDAVACFQQVSCDVIDEIELRDYEFFMPDDEDWELAVQARNESTTGLVDLLSELDHEYYIVELTQDDMIPTLFLTRS